METVLNVLIIVVALLLVVEGFSVLELNKRNSIIARLSLALRERENRIVHLEHEVHDYVEKERQARQQEKNHGLEKPTRVDPT